MSYDRTSFKTAYSLPGYSLLDHLQGSYIRLIRSLNTDQYHTILPEEEGDLPKLAYKFFGTTEAWWIIGVFNGVINPFDDLPSGKVIKIPNISNADFYVKEAKRKSVGGLVVLN
jgi:hypothetical protein